MFIAYIGKTDVDTQSWWQPEIQFRQCRPGRHIMYQMHYTWCNMVHSASSFMVAHMHMHIIQYHWQFMTPSICFQTKVSTDLMQMILYPFAQVHIAWNKHLQFNWCTQTLPNNSWNIPVLHYLIQSLMFLSLSALTYVVCWNKLLSAIAHWCTHSTSVSYMTQWCPNVDSWAVKASSVCRLFVHYPPTLPVHCDSMFGPSYQHSEYVHVKWLFW